MTTTPDLWRGPFTDNATLPFNQESGVVAATIDDQFFAVWVDTPLLAPTRIEARKFDNLGNPLTGDVNISAALGDPLVEPAAVRLPIAGQADGLAVAFTLHQSATNDDIYVVRTNAALVPLEAFIPIDTNFNFLTDQPSITSFADGSLMVAYTRHISDTDWDIVARRVSPTGVLSLDIPLFDDVDRTINSDLATLANGNFVAVFSSDHDGDITEHEVIFTIKTPTGANVVSPTLVPAPPTGARSYRTLLLWPTAGS
jgi:hypothetical protein